MAQGGPVTLTFSTLCGKSVAKLDVKAGGS